jgi:hypothetical protein
MSRMSSAARGALRPASQFSAVRGVTAETAGLLMQAHGLVVGMDSIIGLIREEIAKG